MRELVTRSVLLIDLRIPCCSVVHFNAIEGGGVNSRGFKFEYILVMTRPNFPPRWLNVDLVKRRNVCKIFCTRL